MKTPQVSVMLGVCEMSESVVTASELATAYLDLPPTDSRPAAETVEQLCALATSRDPTLARSASDAIFRGVVEPLGDRFEPSDCDRYLRFFSQVIDFCRSLPAGRPLDDELRAFDLTRHGDVVARAERVRRTRPPVATDLSRVKKVFVLSRVTLGADVAVTSVILGRLKRLFPAAQIGLVGSAKAGSLFAGDERVQLVPLHYQREGTLLERLNAWPALTAALATGTAGLHPDEYLVLDPDSRLTQLGLLPVAPESRCLFFESRSYSYAGSESLSELTGRWLDDVFGSAEEPSYPYMSLADADLQRGDELRESTKARLAAVNLGVGGNPNKRLPGLFERNLLLAMLDAGFRVVLDRGAGEEELQRTAEIIAALERRGKRIKPLESPGSRTADVITWEGSLSGFAGLIRVADRYVGYDSAGGHIAAALGVPGINVFAGSASARMRKRWSPWGTAPGYVIAVGSKANPEDILSHIREQLV